MFEELDFPTVNRDKQRLDDVEMVTLDDIVELFEADKEDEVEDYEFFEINENEIPWLKNDYDESSSPSKYYNIGKGDTSF